MAVVAHTKVNVNAVILTLLYFDFICFLSKTFKVSYLFKIY